jgi:site-specific DNA recombinase
MEGNIMKVVGYIRVSTDEQAREGVSLAAQEAKLCAYAELYELELIGIEVDAGVSAKTLKRPGLQHALARLKAREAEVLLVVKLDRLTRSVKDLGHLVETYFLAGKWLLMSVNDQIDTRTAAGRMVLNILASVSQWEREAIGERTAEAMQHLKASGQVYSRPIFDDAATLTRIHIMRARGATYQDIADELTAAGVPTVRGGTWAPATIMGILRRHPLPVQQEVA